MRIGIDIDNTITDIDDQLNNCLEVSREGIKTIRFTADTTKYEDVISIDNWKEVYKFIKDM